MKIEPVNEEILICYAKAFGSEASANGRTMHSAADRADLAAYYGAQVWAQIPVELRNKLIDAFFDGVETGKQHRF